MELLVHQNPECVELGHQPVHHGSAVHTDMWKTEGLKQALDQYGFDLAFGGARRDEEKSRAKERIFSIRSAQHRWDPKRQRPELWRIYNVRHDHGRERCGCSRCRTGPSSTCGSTSTCEEIPIVPLYFGATRPGRRARRHADHGRRRPDAAARRARSRELRSVRFRTLGCYPLTGAVESTADTLPAIIQEMLLTTTSERQGRVIDHDSSGSMEKKKQEGYF